jgi:hypothetical protein
MAEIPTYPSKILLETLILCADNEGMTEKEWKKTFMSMLAGYHTDVERWKETFKPVLLGLPNAVNGPKWIKKVLP